MNIPSFKEGSLSPLRKMQRYLSQGEAGEVITRSPVVLTSPRRADYYKVALHFLDRRGCPSLRRGYLPGVPQKYNASPCPFLLVRALVPTM